MVDERVYVFTLGALSCRAPRERGVGEDDRLTQQILEQKALIRCQTLTHSHGES
jgi:hypothetical protein